MVKRVLAVVPTLNEEGSVGQVIASLRALDPPVDVVVVDDSSSDGTVSIVRRAAEADPGVSLICRHGKPSFAQSYIEGYRRALADGYEAVVCIDADLSHNPNDVPRLLSALDDADVVIGSRYVNGTINVVNWPLRRLIMSLVSSFYVRLITRLRVSDPMAGFKAIRREALEKLDLDEIRSRGFAFQTDVIYRLHRAGMRLGEVQVVFTDRTAGKSKMSLGRVAEALAMPFRLLFTVRGNKR